MQESLKQNPPLGLVPLQYHREQRLNDIYSAMSRYKAAGLEIPKEWIEEMETLENILQIPDCMCCGQYLDKE